MKIELTPKQKNDVGQKIKSLRKKAGYKRQKDLAKAIGVIQSVIANSVTI